MLFRCCMVLAAALLTSAFYPIGCNKENQTVNVYRNAVGQEKKGPQAVPIRGEIKGLIQDRGMPNKLGDFFFALEISGNIEIWIPGDYTVAGQLVKGKTLISSRPSDLSSFFSAQVLKADKGISKFYLKFSGAEIRESKIDGPYDVEIFLLDKKGVLIDSHMFTTKMYTHTQFRE